MKININVTLRFCLLPCIGRAKSCQQSVGIWSCSPNSKARTAGNDARCACLSHGESRWQGACLISLVFPLLLESNNAKQCQLATTCSVWRQLVTPWGRRRRHSKYWTIWYTYKVSCHCSISLAFSQLYEEPIALFQLLKIASSSSTLLIDEKCEFVIKRKKIRSLWMRMTVTWRDFIGTNFDRWATTTFCSSPVRTDKVAWERNTARTSSRQVARRLGPLFYAFQQ